MYFSVTFEKREFIETSLFRIQFGNKLKVSGLVDESCRVYRPTFVLQDLINKNLNFVSIFTNLILKPFKSSLLIKMQQRLGSFSLQTIVMQMAKADLAPKSTYCKQRDVLNNEGIVMQQNFLQPPKITNIAAVSPKIRCKEIKTNLTFSRAI